MPRSGSSAQHLISYIRQGPLWDAELDGSPTWPDCVWTTKVKPYSGRVSQLMLENPNSTIGFQPVGHYLTIRILTRMAEGQAAKPQRAYAVQDLLASGTASHLPALAPESAPACPGEPGANTTQCRLCCIW